MSGTATGHTLDLSAAASDGSTGIAVTVKLCEICARNFLTQVPRTASAAAKYCSRACSEAWRLETNELGEPVTRR